MGNLLRGARNYLAGRRAAFLDKVSFCESCSGVCTPACRTDGHLDRLRNTTHRAGILR